MWSHQNMKTAEEREFEQEFQLLQGHADLSDRLRKTLYYGKLPKTDRPSLPATNIALEFFNKISTESIGKINLTYAANVSRNACISPCSMMLAMIYLKRLRKRNPDYLQQVSSSDLFLVSVLVASKFLNDEGEKDEVFNDEWADSADKDVADVNQLERDFLSAIDWELFCNEATFLDMLRRVECKIAYQEGLKRGWLSYTDVDVLCERSMSLRFLSCVRDEVVQVVAVCCVAYIAGVMVVVGAVYTSLQITAYLHTLTLPTVGVLYTPTSQPNFSRIACPQLLNPHFESELSAACSACPEDRNPLIESELLTTYGSANCSCCLKRIQSERNPAARMSSDIAYRRRQETPSIETHAFRFHGVDYEVTSQTTTESSDQSKCSRQWGSTTCFSVTTVTVGSSTPLYNLPLTGDSGKPNWSLPIVLAR